MLGCNYMRLKQTKKVTQERKKLTAYDRNMEKRHFMNCIGIPKVPCQTLVSPFFLLSFHSFLHSTHLSGPSSFIPLQTIMMGHAQARTPTPKPNDACTSEKKVWVTAKMTSDRWRLPSLSPGLGYQGLASLLCCTSTHVCVTGQVECSFEIQQKNLLKKKNSFFIWNIFSVLWMVSKLILLPNTNFSLINFMYIKGRRGLLLYYICMEIKTECAYYVSFIHCSCGNLSHEKRCVVLVNG